MLSSPISFFLFTRDTAVVGKSYRLRVVLPPPSHLLRDLYPPAASQTEVTYIAWVGKLILSFVKYFKRQDMVNFLANSSREV